VIEKRLERIVLDQKRGKKPDQTEARLLGECRQHLEAERSLSKNPDLALAPQLRGFAFVSAKPMLVLFNNEDEDEALPNIENIVEHEECLVIRGKLEQELAQMEAEEAREFLSEFNITASAMDRVIRKSYEALGQISFFTVVNKEVRAWAIKKGTEALDAAGTIHTDMQRGFIRAEVIAYNDLIQAGHYREQKKWGPSDWKEKIMWFGMGISSIFDLTPNRHLRMYIVGSCPSTNNQWHVKVSNSEMRIFAEELRSS